MEFGSLKSIIAAGGVVFIFLVFLSIYSLSVILERFFYYRNNFVNSGEFIKHLRHLIYKKDFKKVKDLCLNTKHSETMVGKIIAEILNSDCEAEDVENIIQWNVSSFYKRLSSLATIGSTAPYIGLFGTVLGVMHAFSDLASAGGMAGPGVVAKGISEALINAAAGLFVAIPAVVAYNYFISKINFFIKELEHICYEVQSNRTKIMKG